MKNEEAPETSPNPVAKNGLVDRFLNAFAMASRAGNPLTVMSDDPEGFTAAIAQAPDALASALAADNDQSPIGPAHVQQGAFASAACDNEGRLILADSTFASWALPHGHVRAALDEFTTDRPSISFLVEDRGKYVAVAAAPLANARNWPLAPEVLACLEAGRADIAILARIELNGDQIHASTFTTAFRLTKLEARVCAALATAGDARSCARLAGVTYETARDTLKSAMRKVGVSSQPELVAVMMKLNSGEAPAPPIASVIADVFGLSGRQTQIALAIAQGRTKSEATRATGLSEHIVKAELTAIYAQLGVDSLAALSRAIGQISALSALAEASSVDVVNFDGQPEPLRLIPRNGRSGRIAVSDHGPMHNVPVLIIHTATTGRHLPSDHVVQLQKLGLRPICFDRPGTGLTDMIDGSHIDQTVADMLDILDALSLTQVCVLARGGSMVLARFAANHSDRLLRAASINPEPRPKDDTVFSGFFTGKRIIFDHPALITTLARHLAQRSSSHALASVIKKALAESPADSATLANPTFLAAYIRATQQSAMQNGVGFIGIAKSEGVEHDSPISDGSKITILIGQEDPLYRYQDGLARWTHMWPGCEVRIVPNSGRLLQFQRPDLIAKALLPT